MSWVGILAAVMGACAVIAHAQTAGDCEQRVIDRLPVALVESRPIVDLPMAGRQLHMVLDTGATFNLLTTETARHLNVDKRPLRNPLMLSGVGGPTAILASLIVTDVRLGTAWLPRAKFVVTSVPIGDADGILGAGILEQFDVDFDFSRRRITLLDAGSCAGNPLEAAPMPPPYFAADLQFDASTPTIRGSINGFDIRIRLDTGAATSILDVRAANRAGVVLDSTAAPGGSVQGMGRGRIETWIVPATQIRIGDEDIGHSMIRVGAITLTDADMVLGADFLLSHHLYLSRRRHKVYFSPNGSPVFNLTELPSAGQR